MPEYNDKPVEDVEADADVSTQAVSDHFQQHLDGKQSAEEHVAVFEDVSQRGRLQTQMYTQILQWVSKQYLVCKTVALNRCS